MRTHAHIRRNLVTPMATSALAAAAITLSGCTGGGATGTQDSHSGTVSSLSTQAPASGGTVTPIPEPAKPIETPDSAQSKAAYREGVSLFQSGSFELAADRLQLAALGRPDHPYTHYLLGLSLWKSGRPGEAEVSLERASSLDATSERTWVNLGRVRMDKDDVAGALKAADSALEIDERSSGALHVRGRALAALGRGDEAIETLERAHEIDPENGYIANTIGYQLIQAGRASDAVPFLEQARGRLQNLAFVRNNLGVAYERTGQIEKAVVEYRAAALAGDSEGRAQASLERLEPMITQMTAEGRIPGSTPDASVAKSSPDPETHGTDGTEGAEPQSPRR